MRNTPTISIVPVDHPDHKDEVDLDLDDSVEDAIGGFKPNQKFKITDFGDLDEESFKHFDCTTKNLIKLGELMAANDHDPDLVCAALSIEDGDIDHAENAIERCSWQGSVGEDEKDYAQYVVDEGLMGKEQLDNYLDHEAIGRDYLLESSTTETKDGRTVVWHE